MQLSSFTATVVILNPTVWSGWKFTWSRLTYFPTLVYNFRSIKVREGIEIVSLRVGCVTMWSRGSHHFVSKLGSIYQVISLCNFHSCCFCKKKIKKFLGVQFLFLFDFCSISKNKKKLVISFGYCPKYISCIKNKNKNRSKKIFIGFCRRKLNKRKLDQINSELSQIWYSD